MGSLKVRTDSISGRVICPLGYSKEEALLQPRNGDPTPESLLKRTGSFLRNTETKDSAQLGNGFVLEYEDEEKFAAASGVKSLADSWPKSKSRFLRESLKILPRSCTAIEHRTTILLIICFNITVFISFVLYLKSL